MESAFQAYFSGRPQFHILAFSVVAVIGLLFATAGSRHSIFSKLAEWSAPKVGAFYASAGGTICGWAVGVSFAYLLSSPKDHWLPALALVALATLLVAPPLIILHLAAPVAKKFRDRWEKPLWRVRVVQALGTLLLLSSVVASWARFAT
jgi:hypothetical protein